MMFLTMSVMPLAPLLGAWALTLGARPAVELLVTSTVGTAPIPTLSRPLRSVPGPPGGRSSRL